jgi:hypothetical protein
MSPTQISSSRVAVFESESISYERRRASWNPFGKLLSSSEIVISCFANAKLSRRALALVVSSAWICVSFFWISWLGFFGVNRSFFECFVL